MPRPPSPARLSPDPRCGRRSVGRSHSIESAKPVAQEHVRDREAAVSERLDELELLESREGLLNCRGRAELVPAAITPRVHAPALARECEQQRPLAGRESVPDGEVAGALGVDQLAEGSPDQLAVDLPAFGLCARPGERAELLRLVRSPAGDREDLLECFGRDLDAAGREALAQEADELLRRDRA